MAHLSGWQQISDCVTGVSWLQGKLFGLEEPIVPLIPSSDYQTGMAGLIGILCALSRRNVEGGSYTLSVSLSYFNSFLLSFGTQPEAVQKYLRQLHHDVALRHYDDMSSVVAKTSVSLKKHVPDLFAARHFNTIPANLGGPRGEMTAFVGPAATYQRTKLFYDVGSCFLGMYGPSWP